MMIAVTEGKAMKAKFPIPFVSNWFHNWYRNSIRHPQYRWLIIAGSLLYLVSPLDFAPDLLPVLGWIDDGLITTLLVTEVSQLLVEGIKAKKDKSAQITSSDAVTTITV
jgi:uncharacterized membrane protein YkvA (DUF1232 family)